jgi:SAM-dependent methyltransferase
MIGKYLRSLFPRTTRLPDTAHHRGVYIRDYGFHQDLIMGSLIQSGLIMTQFWRFAISQYVAPGTPIRTALLLGLGAGSNARLLAELYKDIEIDAVEIDRGVIDIAREHFHLDEIPKLHIHHADAIDYASHLDQSYDLILVDCFGDLDIAPELEDIAFLNNLRAHTTYLILNRLYFHHYRAPTDLFLRSLRPHFFTITARRHTNLAVYLP